MKEELKQKMIAVIGSYPNSLIDSLAENCAQVAIDFYKEREQALNTSNVVGQFVCGHPPNRTYLNDGNWNCEKCGGQWPSLANK